MKALARYQLILVGEQRHIGVNKLPKVVARQCSGRPGVELETSRSRVQHASHYATKPLVSTSASDCLERVVTKVTYYVSVET